jgi:two-component system, NarL family, nitrate/nitrite response regulator NarL
MSSPSLSVPAPHPTLDLAARPPKSAIVDILVAAFHPEVRGALQRRLRAGGMSAALEVDSAAGLERALTDCAEPLVLSGLHWPETAPFLATGRSHEAPVALLLEEPWLDARHAAFRAGAAALLPWPIPVTALPRALESIACGFRLLPRRPSLAPGAAPRLSAAALSTRERELLELVASGLTNKSIARRLDLSINTVKYHLASIFAKLDARTRAEAVSEAARRGELML